MAALVLGGVHAGVGKSILALGLAAALRAEGLTVSSYSVGPGLPQHPPEHSSCLGKLPQQPAGLDGWLLSPDAARAAFHSLSAGADISIVEGCLGLFDGPGADGSEQGSTAQVTQWLQAPVVLVIDAQAFKSARSIVALIKGYAVVDGGLCVAGVILNKVASKALLGELADGLTAAGLDVAVLGGVPKLEELSSSSGSKQPACPWFPGSTTSSSCCSGSQCQQQQQQLLPCSPQHLGQLLAQHIDLRQLRAVAARAAVPRPQAPLPPPVRTYRVSMGIAHDEAFFQYLQQNLHMLGAAGVQLVPFSPLHDSKLPPGLSAVLLGSGAVSEFGQQLAANSSMLEALRAFAAAGGLVLGEGAALMYLSRSLQRPGQQQHAMVGLLPFHTKEQQQQEPSSAASYVAVNVQASAHPLLLPVAKVAAAECNVPVVCRLVDGPDGMPRYKLDEDHIRRAQPSLVVVACEENSRDEPHVQHHQQLQDSTRRQSAGGGGEALAAAAQGGGSGGAAAGWAWQQANPSAGQVSSTTNGAVAVPGRVRLEVSVVQRVLQRAGVLWPEQRAVVLYQRCHSMSEVLEFILVLANAAGVPERGVQLVAGLRARLRAAACRIYSSVSSSASSLAGSRRGSDTGVAGSAAKSSPLVVVLDGVSPVRLAGFWLPEMLQLAGAQQASICPAAAEPPRSISWAQLRAAAPGMLVLALQGLDAGQAALHIEQLAAQPGFWSLPAVQSGAVYAVDHTLLCRPGPGLVLGVELLGHMVAPEKLALPAGLPMGSVLKLSLHSGQRCRPRLLPNYMARYC
ncbi:hypothetical protein OEZ86_000587 [Tetradesmus obliquus]|nr:hypothetical protein OEZ86_000587 [Tetradesmus obliquus]